MLALCPQAALLRPCSSARSSNAFRSSKPSGLRAMAAHPLSSKRALVVALAAANDDSAATAQGLAAVHELDALIDTLMEQKNPQDLAQAVAENIMSFDQRFWLRLATRSDSAADDEAKQQLAALAKVGRQRGGPLGCIGGPQNLHIVWHRAVYLQHMSDAVASKSDEC